MVESTLMVRLFFTGIKHSGKTTQARLAAQRTGLGYADADDLILQFTGAESIRSFYREHGKAAFMNAELSAVRKYIDGNDSFILSLGGGASDNTPLMDLMKSTGRIIYLRRDEKDMLPVILKHGIPAFLDPDDLEGSFSRIYRERDGVYRRYADLVIDLGSYGEREAAADRVIEALEDKGYVQHIR